MESTVTVLIKDVRRKVSNMENIYHEIDIVESVNPTDDRNEVIKRDWTKLFYSEDIATNTKEDLIGKEVEITLKFYPVKRQVGDQVYTNINCHISHIKGT